MTTKTSFAVGTLQKYIVLRETSIGDIPVEVTVCAYHGAKHYDNDPRATFVSLGGKHCKLCEIDMLWDEQDARTKPYPPRRSTVNERKRYRITPKGEAALSDAYRHHIRTEETEPQFMQS